MGLFKSKVALVIINHTESPLIFYLVSLHQCDSVFFFLQDDGGPHYLPHIFPIQLRFAMRVFSSFITHSHDVTSWTDYQYVVLKARLWKSSPVVCYFLLCLCKRYQFCPLVKQWIQPLSSLPAADSFIIHIENCMANIKGLLYDYYESAN